ncbi:MAG TPA: 6,7-dimethyl-8-ribityllumazine synthase [Acidimicrobiales bacterium]|nr:6,7-dimethyl-8-ribityllumazine synthase [Acidimicrobiales bacterium]
MTSSDETLLEAGAVEALSAEVGESHDGRSERAAAGGARLAMVGAKFNGGITTRLFDGALRALRHRGLDPSTVEVAWVPGAFELPLAADRFARSGRFDAVVALGAVIRGETAHFDYVAGGCATGLQRVALQSGVPVIFGVLTTDDVPQALARSAEGTDNKGYEAVVSALEMVDLLSLLPKAPA